MWLLLASPAHACSFPPQEALTIDEGLADGVPPDAPVLGAVDVHRGMDGSTDGDGTGEISVPIHPPGGVVG